MADVFISYKSDRRAAAEHLAETIRGYGYSVWWDYGLVTGRDFGAQIETELRAAKAVVVLWCSLSVNSEWVREEAGLAKRLGTIMPTFIEKVDLPLGFSRTQTLDLSGWDGAPHGPVLDRLLDDIARLVGHPPKPDREGLDRTERAWRRIGAPVLSGFALGVGVEPGAPPRTMTSAVAQEARPQTKEKPKPRHRGLVILLAILALAGLGYGVWRFMSAAPGGPPTSEADAALPLPDGFYLVLEDGMPEEDIVQIPNNTPGAAPLKIQRQPLLPVARVASAQAGVDSRGESIVTIQLSAAGRDEMMSATTANVGRRMAIVVNGVAVSDPVIREPIAGGFLEISGALTPAQARAIADRLNRQAGKR